MQCILEPTVLRNLGILNGFLLSNEHVLKHTAGSDIDDKKIKINDGFL